MTCTHSRPCSSCPSGSSCCVPWPAAARGRGSTGRRFRDPRRPASTTVSVVAGWRRGADTEPFAHPPIRLPARPPAAPPTRVEEHQRIALVQVGHQPAQALRRAEGGAHACGLLHGRAPWLQRAGGRAGRVLPHVHVACQPQARRPPRSAASAHQYDVGVGGRALRVGGILPQHHDVVLRGAGRRGGVMSGSTRRGTVATPRRALAHRVEPQPVAQQAADVLGVGQRAPELGRGAPARRRREHVVGGGAAGIPIQHPIQTYAVAAAVRQAVQRTRPCSDDRKRPSLTGS